MCNSFSLTEDTLQRVAIQCNCYRSKFISLYMCMMSTYISYFCFFFQTKTTTTIRSKTITVRNSAITTIVTVVASTSLRSPINNYNGRNYYSVAIVFICMYLVVCTCENMNLLFSLWYCHCSLLQ